MWSETFGPHYSNSIPYINIFIIADKCIHSTKTPKSSACASKGKYEEREKKIMCSMFTEVHIHDEMWKRK